VDLKTKLANLKKIHFIIYYYMYIFAYELYS
jgi:hypothetical protein